jgi:hypothetical protein
MLGDIRPRHSSAMLPRAIKTALERCLCLARAAAALPTGAVTVRATLKATATAMREATARTVAFAVIAAGPKKSHGHGKH